MDRTPFAVIYVKEEEMQGTRVIQTLVAMALLSAPAAAAQDTVQPFFFEVRGGVNGPTFDIADAADPGPSFGGTLGYMVAPRVSLMAEGDFGFHKSALPTGPDINVFHYIGKVGYTVFENNRLSVMLNAGAGAMTFDVDGGTSNTYPAINVGGKILYKVSPQIALLLSPQGDIAFSDEDEIGTTNSWVWPLSAGLRISFP